MDSGKRWPCDSVWEERGSCEVTVWVQCSGIKWCNSHRGCGHQRGGRWCSAGVDSSQVSCAANRYSLWGSTSCAGHWADRQEDSCQNCPKHGGTWWKSGRITCLKEAQDPFALRPWADYIYLVFPTLEAVIPFHWDENVFRNIWKTGDFLRGSKVLKTMSAAGASATLNCTVSVKWDVSSGRKLQVPQELHTLFSYPLNSREGPTYFPYIPCAVAGPWLPFQESQTAQKLLLFFCLLGKWKLCLLFSNLEMAGEKKALIVAETCAVAWKAFFFFFSFFFLFWQANWAA